MAGGFGHAIGAALVLPEMVMYFGVQGNLAAGGVLAQWYFWLFGCALFGLCSVQRLGMRSTEI